MLRIGNVKLFSFNKLFIPHLGIIQLIIFKVFHNTFISYRLKLQFKQ